VHLATRPRPRRLRRAAAAGAVAVALLAGLAPAASAASAESSDTLTAAAAPAAHLDRAGLDAKLRAIHTAGIYGVYSSVRDGQTRYDGAAGLADVATGRPVRPDLQHRVGSVTKSFTAVAVLQQSAKGRIDLDRPVGDYVPELVPGERGRKVTVRMLLNHTSGIADYILDAFPSLAQGSTQSLDDFRYRTVRPAELIGHGVARPQLFEPGAHWSYSNTNYVLLGEILRKVTGQDPEQLITRDVIRRAKLRNTYFPGTDPRIHGPHARMYENWYGLIDPPRDYSDYNMTWGGTAGALVSTPQDLAAFYRALFQGELLPRRQLDEMRTTVDVKGPNGEEAMKYGLGIYSVDTPCGPAWGHEGAVFGSGTVALSSPDGKRQVALGFNLMKYQRVDATGTRLLDHPADAAMGAYRDQALCGTTAPAPKATGRAPEAAPPVLPLLPHVLGDPAAVR
jgi:D-alanyl-D-alanine carboxypeptidase